MALLDQKVGRRVDPLGREVGLYKRVEVKVAPMGKHAPVKAVTYQAVDTDRSDVPPTRRYMDMVVQGACAHGLSSMWLEYLRTFTTQVGREPRAIQILSNTAQSQNADVVSHAARFMTVPKAL
jgi:hypothetical protein